MQISSRQISNCIWTIELDQDEAEALRVIIGKSQITSDGIVNSDVGGKKVSRPEVGRQLIYGLFESLPRGT